MRDVIKRLREPLIGPNATTKDAIDAIKAKDRRIAELEGERKRDCCEFFRWFWNAPGTNAEQGYDQWKALKD